MHAVCVIYFAAPSHLARLTKHAFPLALPPSTLVVFFDLAVVAHLCTSNAPTDDGRGPSSVLRAVAITSNRCRPPIHSIYRSDEVLPLPDRHGVAVAVRGDSRALFLRSAVE